MTDSGTLSLIHIVQRALWFLDEVGLGVRDAALFFGYIVAERPEAYSATLLVMQISQTLRTSILYSFVCLFE
jgi:hypothetical protein